MISDKILGILSVAIWFKRNDEGCSIGQSLSWDITLGSGIIEIGLEKGNGATVAGRNKVKDIIRFSVFNGGSSNDVKKHNGRRNSLISKMNGDRIGITLDRGVDRNLISFSVLSWETRNESGTIDGQDPTEKQNYYDKDIGIGKGKRGLYQKSGLDKQGGRAHRNHQPINEGVKLELSRIG